MTIVEHAYLKRGLTDFFFCQEHFVFTTRYPMHPLWACLTFFYVGLLLMWYDMRKPGLILTIVFSPICIAVGYYFGFRKRTQHQETVAVEKACVELEDLQDDINEAQCALGIPTEGAVDQLQKQIDNLMIEVYMPELENPNRPPPVKLAPLKPSKLTLQHQDWMRSREDGCCVDPALLSLRYNPPAALPAKGTKSGGVLTKTQGSCGVKPCGPRGCCANACASLHDPDPLTDMEMQAWHRATQQREPEERAPTFGVSPVHTRPSNTTAPAPPRSPTIELSPVAAPAEGGLLRFFGIGSASVEDVPVSDSKVSGTCCVCLGAPTTHVVLPCGHKCVCRECAAVIPTLGENKCPICRVEVMMVTEVFDS